ncbi:hypothetical protein F894_01634 [Acinetobacter sp. CIP 51.11]|nr:hypothetical protein F894_01634 [Acinetobacter sp. CIP 51.11]
MISYFCQLSINPKILLYNKYYHEKSILHRQTNLGRIQLSKSFFMRDFLYSEIANWYGVPNFPDHPEKAIYTGIQLCEQLLEPLQEKFGRIAIRSAFAHLA